MFKKILAGIVVLLGILIIPFPSEAAVISQYKILSSEAVIDSQNSTAMVDTVGHEIRLPYIVGERRISFSGEDYDYVALTKEKVIHFSFDGTKMVENKVASVSGLTNPLSVFSSASYPDVVVASSTDVKHYSFTGSEMVENPALSVSGLTKAASIASRNNDVAFIEDKQLEHYIFDGSGMTKLPNLSINSGLNNPVEAALFASTYDVAVLEPDQVRFYFFTGDKLTENPDIALRGFTSPLKSISAIDGTIAVVEGDKVKTYLYDGAGYSYVQALSVTSSLTTPSCVALKPGSRDMIVADGDNIKYFMFDGTKLVYNENLSKQVLGLSAGKRYMNDAVVQSAAFTRKTTATRITACCNVPEATSITWSIYAGGWMPVWRLRGLSGSTVLEYTPDSGITWNCIGNESTPVPGSNLLQLWKEHILVRSVKWKAEMHTDNPKVTPKIIAPNPGVNTAVMLEANRKPGGNIVSDSCYLTMTPTISWTFKDLDGDSQSGYDFRISSGDTDLYTYSTHSSTPSHTMLPSEDPAIPSKIWISGLNAFTLRIRVKDGVQWSDWIEKPISFRAFERPRIAELSVPADGETSPVLGNLSTHKVIKQGMTARDLPCTKAGGQVTMYIDSIGMVDLAPPAKGSLIFPYLGQTATIGEISLDTTKVGIGRNKRWKIKFWTDPNKIVCPDNTIVKMDLTGTSGGYYPDFNVPPFAGGIVKTKGSVLDNWIVVLQGSN